MSNVSKCFFCANKKDYDAKLGYFGCAYSGQECKKYSMFEPKVKPKPQTNADRVRSMTDEELARLFADENCGYCRIHDFCFAKGCQIDCEDMWLDWLREEADHD